MFTMQPVSESLRKELLALDPCVSEDFLKLYISFKAESYFVNVVPQGVTGQGFQVVGDYSLAVACLRACLRGCALARGRWSRRPG
jgi:hypothetical protein